MSTFSNKSYNIKGYLNYRPVYPDSLYTHLREYIGLKDSSDADVAVDLGCGTGQATLALANKVATKVFGVDPSESMIKEATTNSGQARNIDFIVGNDGTLTSQFKKHSVDLVTVAEAAHWMSYPDFWEAAHYILKPGGTLAIWSYYFVNIIGHPETAKIVEDFSLNPEKCGGYWDDGQSRLNDLYAGLTLPTTLYEDEERVVNDYFELRPEQPFELVRKDVPLRQLIDLLGTYSAYYKWKKANPEKKDIVEEAKEKILAATGLTLDSLVTIKWSSVYIFAKTKQLSD